MTPARTTDTARALRRTPTLAEQRLWRVLRDRQLAGAKFRRQHPVGPYVADFACVASRLIPEIDGGQHADSTDDARRTAWLTAEGWRVVRFWNNEMLQNQDGVLQDVVRLLAEHPPSPRPSPRGRGSSDYS